MKAEIVRITGHKACEARTENQLLIVFEWPATPSLHLGDTLTLRKLAVDTETVVMETVDGLEFVVRAEIHDLRLPSGHGTSCTPSRDRLRGA
jgi:hypothetical protein